MLAHGQTLDTEILERLLQAISQRGLAQKVGVPLMEQTGSCTSDCGLWNVKVRETRARYPRECAARTTWDVLDDSVLHWVSCAAGENSRSHLPLVGLPQQPGFGCGR